MIACTTDSWTGTKGRGITIVHSPEEDVDAEIRIAKAAVEHVIKTRGFDFAHALTLDQMVETLTDDPL